MEPEVRPAARVDLMALRGRLPADDLAFLQRRRRRWCGRVLVAVVGERPVGAIFVFWGRADEPEVRRHLARVPILFRLRVAAAHRGRGMGTALIRAAESLLRRRGHSRVLVGVDQINPRARDLYLSLGYGPHPVLRGLPGSDGPYDILVRELGPQ